MLTNRLPTVPELVQEMGRFREQMTRLFNNFDLDPSRWPALAVSYPAVNVWEDSDHVYAEAELPGVPQDKIELFVSEGNQLTIQGERHVLEDAKGVWHRRERGFGKFSRTVTLPCLVDADRVEAKLEQGVLTVMFPKSEAAKPRRISVKSE
jgi:HSP20 family protein